jgi:hypothetical protein
VTSSYLEGQDNAYGAYGYNREGKKGKIGLLCDPQGEPYITAITKPQIEVLLNSGVLQMELFADELCEVEHEGRRYVLRRNPLRAEELAASRAEKQASAERVRQQCERYLADHPRAKVTTAEKAVRAKMVQLKLQNWLQVGSEERRLS